MATSFPGSLDTYVNPTGSDQLSTGPSGGVSHATMHANVHDALSALQAKVGVDSSAVTSSLDYRMAQAEKNAPVGTVAMFAGSAAPSGWLLCQGQTVDYATYPELAAVFGVAGGTFTLPDLRQRVPVGSGTGYTLRSSDGSESVSITLAETNLPSHSHTVNHSHTVADHQHTIPNHSHTIPDHLHEVPQHGHGNNISADQSSHSHTVNPPNTAVNINDPAHAHNLTVFNNGTFSYPLSTGDFSGQGGTAVTSITTDLKFTGITASVDIAQFDSGTADPGITISGGVSDKPAFNTVSKTNFATNDKTNLSTNDKTGLSTSGPATVTSGATGNGTAFSVDVVQPYFVLNFMIRVDD